MRQNSPDISSILDDNLSPAKGAWASVVDVDGPWKPHTKQSTNTQATVPTREAVRLSYHGVGPPQSTSQYFRCEGVPLCRGVHKICVALSIECDVSLVLTCTPFPSNYLSPPHNHTHLLTTTPTSLYHPHPPYHRYRQTIFSHSY